MATKADVLLLKHPGTGELSVPKTQAKLAEQLELSGFVHCRYTRAGILKLTLTAAGAEHQEDLRLASINRGRPATPAPPPTALRAAAPRKPAVHAAPRKPAVHTAAPRKPAVHAAAPRKPATHAAAPRATAPRATAPAPRTAAAPRKPAARKPAARKPAARQPAVPPPAPPRTVAAPAIPSPRKPLPPTKRVPSLDDLFGEGAFHPEAAEQRPATVADLRALEQRLLARLDQLATEIAARTPRV